MIMEKDFRSRFLHFLQVVTVLGLLYGFNQLALYNMNYIYILAGSIVVFLYLGCLVMTATTEGLPGVKEYLLGTIYFAIFIGLVVGMLYIVGYIVGKAISKDSYESYEPEDNDDEPQPYDWQR
jgi:hypothetical protein